MCAGFFFFKSSYLIQIYSEMLMSKRTSGNSSNTGSAERGYKWSNSGHGSAKLEDRHVGIMELRGLPWGKVFGGRYFRFYTVYCSLLGILFRENNSLLGAMENQRVGNHYLNCLYQLKSQVHQFSVWEEKTNQVNNTPNLSLPCLWDFSAMCNWILMWIKYNYFSSEIKIFWLL